MQVKQFQGLWFLYDNKDHKIYAYEKDTQEPLCLGTVNTETGQITLRPDWQHAYQGKLNEYRATEKPKNRVPTAA